MSELQAMAIGVPLAAPVDSGFYPPPIPVLGGDTPEEIADKVSSAVCDPVAMSEKLQARRWIEAHHSPDVAVERLAAIYRELA